MKRTLYLAVLLWTALPFIYAHDTAELTARLAEINRLIALSPQDVPTLYRMRARIFYMLGKHEEAADDYSYLIVIDPGRYGHYCLLRSIVFYEKDKFDEALDDINKAIDSDSDKGVYYFHRGRIYFYVEEYYKAIDDFTKAIELDPDDYDYFVQRGRVYFHLGNYNEAIADYSRALPKTPPESLYLVYSNRGVSYLLQVKFQHALRDVNRAIECSPEQPAPYSARAMIYEEQARHAIMKRNKNKFQELAKEDYAMAEKLGWKWKEAKDNHSQLVDEMENL